MAATTMQVPPATAPALAATVGTPTFAGVLRSEFTKIRSVRSTYWTLLVLVVVTVGFGALASFGSTRGGAHGPFFDATQRALGGLYISQLVIGVLGVLVISSEYSTGMIRTTLTMLPRRGLMVAAKAVVFAVVAFVTGLITCFVSFFLGQAIMSGHVSLSLSQPNVLRAVIGGALFLTACGLLAFGLGLLIRHTAGAITAVVGLLFLLTILVNFLPQTWQNDLDKWMPADAGTQIWTTVPNQGQPPLFAPWTGFAVFCGYAAIALIAAVIMFRKRDA